MAIGGRTRVSRSVKKQTPLAWKGEAPERMACQHCDGGGYDCGGQRYDEAVEQGEAELFRLATGKGICFGYPEDAPVMTERRFVDHLYNALHQLRFRHQRSPKHPKEGNHRPQEDEYRRDEDENSEPPTLA